MRQVSRDELIYKVAAALRATAPGLLKELTTGQQDRRTQTRVIVATAIVDRALRSFEILSDQDLPMMGEATYSRPLANMLGEDPPSLGYVDE